MAKVYPEEEKQRHLDQYYSSGLSQQKYAQKNNIPRSTFKDWIRKYPKKAKKVKILTYDIEAAPMTLEYKSYDLKVYLSRHSIDHIKKDWYMLGAAWKLLGDKNVSCVSVKPNSPDNDEGVVKALHAALDSADILIGHNSDAFDLKKFNARAIIYGLPPIAPKQSIDTLKVARRYFKFSSNTLRYVAQTLGVGMKDESPDWVKILEGDPQELAYMRKYNKQDVIVTENVYLKLRPYIINHPNLNVYINQKTPDGLSVPLCPKCGSANILMSDSHLYTNAGKYNNYQCADCGGWSKGKKNLTKFNLR